jgi:disulfide bond formation protein DsbB
MTPLAQNVTDLFSFGTLVVDILCVFLIILFFTPLKKSEWGRPIARFLGKNSISLTFITCLLSIIGGLFYSSIAGFQPCVLCWWQRIFLYPQAVILAIAFFTDDEHIHKYSLALSSLGILVSIYNVYLQFGGTDAINCSAGGATSCSIRYFVEYGYITIPTMALTAFTLLLILMLFRRNSRQSLLE